ncbi:ABC transporter ATP-binding protein [Ornithinibacillus gellani]|uniref:ABC transporter ATP-binding protein n=1 Tax=Ornithinibacillus gellani TaxID=2293253 RepID=UPI000F49180A|nr:ABC transporter ATP-binding protein [Ornithinibacillus gellani]TQS74771.1 ABC transporter ATP-binding protein [Ornithinibacillus gellani]
MSEPNKVGWKPFFSLISKSKLPWGLYILTFIVMISTASVTLMSPLILQKIMSGEIFDAKLVFQYIGLAIVTAITVSLSGFTRIFANARTTRNIQNTLWSKYIRVPLPFFNKEPSLLLISRLTHDPTHINGAINYTMSLLMSTYSLVGSIIIMWGMNVKLTLVLLPVIPYILIVTLVVGHFTQKTQERVQYRYSGMTAFIAERLPKIRLIRSFGKEGEEIENGKNVIENQYKADVSRAVVDLYGEPLLQSVQGIIMGLVLIYGGYLTSIGELDIGSLIAFYLYSANIHNNVQQYGLFYQVLKGAKGAAHKISKIVDSDSEKYERSKAFDEVLQSSNGNLALEHVSFSYEERNVLKNVSFTIPKGKVTAIVGPSGGGKTTILSLIERFYEPNVGRLTFGNIPSEQIHLDDWRNAFSYVSQGSPILSGTIRENITYGTEREVSDEEVIQAAKKANAYGFIKDFPDGFETEVGEMGSKLSGGQRQRIAIARAIIKNPKYLLLDEATSSLDIQTTTKIQAALDELMVGRTTIVVAHNLSTVQEANHIVVVEHGMISGQGKHDELMESNKLYRELVEIQFAKEQMLAW